MRGVEVTNKVQVLDHGYLGLTDVWGSDESIVAAARMSTDKGFLGWGPIAKKVPSKLPSGGETIEEVPGDEKLLAYLYKNRHDTPFEMAGMVIEVQAPIFVYREWHRHRTQSYNEMSGRYVPLPDLNYVPTVERLMINSKTNKQAGVVKGAEELSETGAKLYQGFLQESYKESQWLYEKALGMGVPKELARVHLPVGRYSRMRASANLRNWLAFLTLRNDPKAQWEIQVYAREVAKLIEQQFPRTYELYRLGR